MTGGPTIALPDKDLGITWQLHSGNWMENGPFFGVFSYEVGHQPHFTRQRFGWFGLGAEHFVSFLSSSTTATSIGVLGDYASVVNTIDRRTAYNTNAERLMAVVFFTTKSGFFVMASHGKEFEQGAAGTVNIARGGPLPDRVTWLGLGFTTP